MRKKSFLSVLLLLVVFLLNACGNNGVPTSIPSSELPTDAVTDPNQSLTETAYPIPEETEGYIGTVYPVGQAPTLDPLTNLTGTIEPNFVPEMNPDKAAVYGVLTSFTDKEPLKGVMIYAADIVIVETSGDKIYTTQEKSSPHDGTDDLGHFTITEINPGKYQLMLITPFGSYPIFYTNYDLVELELKAGEVIFLDEILVNWP